MIIYYEVLVVGLAAAVFVYYKCRASLIYALVPAFLTLPVALAGNSMNAGIFPIHLSMLAVIFRLSQPHTLYKIVFNRFSVCAYGIVLIALAHVPIGEFTRFSTYGTLNLILSIIFLGAIYYGRQTSVDSGAGMKTFLICAMLYSLACIIHNLNIVDLSAKYYFGPRLADITMSMGTAYLFLASYKITTGGLLTISVFCAIASLFRGGNKTLGVACLALLSFALLLTNSRTDLVALAVSLIFLQLLLYPGAFLVVIMEIFFVVAMFLMTTPDMILSIIETLGLSDEEGQRFVQIFSGDVENSSAAGRLNDVIAVPRFIVTQPLRLFIGQGFGNFRVLQETGVAENAFGHNIYLNYFGELGLPGLVLLICLIVMLMSVPVSRLFKVKRIQANKAFAARFTAIAVAFWIDRLIAGCTADVIFYYDGTAAYSLAMVMMLGMGLTVARQLDRGRHAAMRYQGVGGKTVP
ncbi:O-antigen ligase family protein [Sphingomonas sp.]|uniref:O-antigen ligase family protein n=1 Tax=Sphingomonas sp. TaxID=28214 RepID=UPI0035C87536